MENGEIVNQAKVAGLVKGVKKWDSDRASFFVDADGKRIPCSVYKNKALTDLIQLFADDDYIQVVGFLNPWSKKDDETGGWTNGMNVQVLKIANKPPERKKAEPKQGRMIDDDDFPF